MKILTVDDDENQLKILGLSLRSCGFDVKAAAGGEQAIDRLKKNPKGFDLVLTDFTMPGINGMELLKIMGKKYPAIPVVMMSASEEKQLADHAIKNGCRGFLRKPFTIEELGREIQKFTPIKTSNNLKKEEDKMAQDVTVTGQATQAASMKTGKFLTFTLEDEEYGIGILEVKEIIGMMPVTSVPRTPDFVKGVVNLRGKVIPVIDLRLKFSMDSIPYTDRTCIIVVEIDSDGTTVLIGILVDAVSEVLNIGREEIEGPPQFGTSLNTDYILGMAKMEGGVKILLDINKILSQEEVATLDNVS